ncbi:17449_t:CDS:2, partial [Gigaspora rosea]
PIAPPNSLWFGVLDLAQYLSQKTTQIVSLALCYYLELFQDIVQEDIEKYQATLSATSQRIFEKIIHDVTQKFQLSLHLVEQSSVTSVEEKLEIKNFLILTCGHSISYYAITKWKEVLTIENRPFECPFCKNEIELESTYNLPKNKVLEGLYKKLQDAGYFNKLPEEQKILPNKLYTVEDDFFLKFNKYKIFQGSIFSKAFTPIFQKVQPKAMLPAFNKAAKAEQHEDYE